MKYRFQHLKQSSINWEAIESTHENTCFHTKKWAGYVKDCGYKPYVVEIREDETIIGYFVGTIVGWVFKAVFAPFPSLGYTQGIVLNKSIEYEERIQLYQELAGFILSSKRIFYLSIDDWQLKTTSQEWNEQYFQRNEQLGKASIQHTIRPTIFLQMEKSIEELWDGLHYKSAKYSINKARKLGLYTRIITKKEDIKPFVDIHSQQIQDVCDRHHSRPHLVQTKKRILKACEAMFPDRVLMIQVVGKDERNEEQVMASAVFFIGEAETIYSTSASFSLYQKYCPNELMVWEAICELKKRGCRELNYGGMHSYKLKYGTMYAYVPKMKFTKFGFIEKIIKRCRYYYDRWLNPQKYRRG